MYTHSAVPRCVVGSGEAHPTSLATQCPLRRSVRAQWVRTGAALFGEPPHIWWAIVPHAGRATMARGRGIAHGRATAVLLAVPSPAGPGRGD